MLLVAVVLLELAPKEIVVPSTRIFSSKPLIKPLTVNVRPVMVCPASTVLMLAEVNTVTAVACVEPAPSLKVGLAAVADNVGASLTALMLVPKVTAAEL